MCKDPGVERKDTEGTEKKKYYKAISKHSLSEYSLGT